MFVKGGQTPNDSYDNEPTPSIVALIYPLCSHGLITSYLASLPRTVALGTKFLTHTFLGMMQTIAVG